jgi:hypothetical protein
MALQDHVWFNQLFQPKKNGPDKPDDKRILQNDAGEALHYLFNL